MFGLLQKSFEGSIIGTIILLFPLTQYMIIVLFAKEDVKAGARFLGKEYGRFLIIELPNLIGIFTFMSFVAIFTKFAIVFFIILALLLVYVCIKGIDYRNELRKAELPKCFIEDIDMFVRFWRGLTQCACCGLFALLLYVGSEFAKTLTSA